MKQMKCHNQLGLEVNFNLNKKTSQKYPSFVQAKPTSKVQKTLRLSHWKLGGSEVHFTSFFGLETRTVDAKPCHCGQVCEAKQRHFAERCEKYNFRVSVGWFQSERLGFVEGIFVWFLQFVDVFWLLLRLMRWLEWKYDVNLVCLVFCYGKMMWSFQSPFLDTPIFDIGGTSILWLCYTLENEHFEPNNWGFEDDFPFEIG